MKVKALRTFRDLKAERTRSAGDVFEASKERFDELNQTEFGMLVVAVAGSASETPEPVAPVKSETEENAAPAADPTPEPEGQRPASETPEPVAPVKSETEEKAAPEEKPPASEPVAFPDEKLSVQHLKDILDARGVEYRGRPNRDELLELKRGSD